MLDRILYKIFLLFLKRYERHKLDVLRKNSQVQIHSTFFYEVGVSFEISEQIKSLIVEYGVTCRKNCFFLMLPGAELTIRNNVFFNNFCSVNCLGLIEIGENTIFGEGVKIYDHNHLYSYDHMNKLHVERDKFKTGKVIIGRNCWIGSNVTILNNVEIGDNVIIGANCLVHKSIASNTILKCKQEYLLTK